MSFKTPLIVEQHFHGAFGVDFNKASLEDIIFLSKKLPDYGIGYFFPTLVTDSVENIKRQITVIREAAKCCPMIAGIHLEGIFINSLKKGIHNTEHFLPLTPENYRLIEDDFIKIVTLAPELDKGLIAYLKNKNVKVQAGHCIGGDLKNIDGTTHTYNAMSPISHRGESTVLSALVNDNIYSEIIADGVHVSDEALKLFLKSKPEDKVILVSDALPITESDLKETIFADSKIYYDGEKATSKDGTIAGSTTMLNKIIKILHKKSLFKEQFLLNPYNYHGLKPLGEITWDNDMNIVDVDLKGGNAI